MNEFNIDKEDPDQHWENFKRILFLIGGTIVVGIILILKYC